MGAKRVHVCSSASCLDEILLHFALLSMKWVFAMFWVVCVHFHWCDWSCDSLCERECGLNGLTWLSCCTAPVRGGRVIRVLECEVPIEL